MARPTKHNVTYFPHDCDMRNDVKIKSLRRKFGHKGYSFWNMILEFLGDCEYFEYEWNEFNKELLSADFDLDVSEINEIVDYLLFLELLKIEEGFLTCDNFTKRLESEVLTRRKDYDGNNSLRKKMKVVNEEITRLNQVNVNINGQSKVKESKEEDSIRNESEVYKTEVKEIKENHFQLEVEGSPLEGEPILTSVGSSDELYNAVLNGLNK